MSWLAQYFLNPSFVIPGAALVSVPIIIHLLSRLRYKKVRFAAMEFLLQSDELNRRRLIIEQLLLLLLRTLAVALIVLLLAKFILDPSAMLMLRGATTHHVIVIDDSLSMQAASGNQTVFNKAVDSVLRMISAGENRPGRQRVSILLASEADRPLVTDRQLDSALVQELTPRLNNLKCSFLPANVHTALQSASNLIGGDGGVAPVIHYLTDLRTSDWNNDPDLKEVIEKLEKANATIQVVQVSDAANSNLAITKLDTDRSSTAVGVPFRLNLTLHNFSDQQASGLRATVLVNGNALPIRILIPDIEANSDAVMAHDITFDSPGLQEVEVRIEEDNLLADNRRFTVVEVTDERRVLIIDDETRQDDARFVSLAISDPELTGVTTEIRNPDVLTSFTLDLYDSIYLLNVSELPADAVQKLRSYVVKGGGIAWFPDESASVSWYNSLANAELPLFPTELTTIHSETDATGNNDAFQVPSFEAHPIFLAYNDPESGLADVLQFRKWFRTSEQPPLAAESTSLQILARMTDGSSIAFEHQLGQGKVLTFLTTAGRRWSNWPIADTPGYVVMHLLIQQHLQKPSSLAANMPLTGELKFTWPVDAFSETIQIFLPELTSQNADDEIDAADTFLRLQASPVETNQETAPEKLAISIPQADRPGVYRIQRFELNGETQDSKLAMNITTTESNLAVADATAVVQLSEEGSISVLEASESSELSHNEAGQEIRNLLLGLLIAVLIAEQLLSLRLSFHPETA